MSQGKHQQLLDLIHQVGNRFVAIEKDLVVQHEGANFHASEIHLLSTIADAPGINPTTIAERLNVTKGAVSQTLARLERKTAIRRDVDPANNAALRVTLTPTGSGALTAFEKRIESQWAAFSAELHKLDRRDRQTVVEFLGTLRTFLNKLA